MSRVITNADGLETVVPLQYRDNGWGANVRSYVLQPYQLVKDLRTGTQTGNVKSVLDGGIDEFLKASLEQRIYDRQFVRDDSCAKMD